MQTPQMWHDCDSIFLIQLLSRVTDLIYKHLYDPGCTVWFPMIVIKIVFGGICEHFCTENTRQGICETCWHPWLQKGITFLGQGCPGTIWDIPGANRSIGKKRRRGRDYICLETSFRPTCDWAAVVKTGYSSYANIIFKKCVAIERKVFFFMAVVTVPWV